MKVGKLAAHECFHTNLALDSFANYLFHVTRMMTKALCFSSFLDTHSQVDELKMKIQALMSSSLLSQINSTLKDKLEDVVNRFSL